MKRKFWRRLLAWAIVSACAVLLIGTIYRQLHIVGSRNPRVGSRNPGAVTPPTKRSSAEVAFEEIDDYLSSLPTGHIAFDVPKQMRYLETKQVHVVLSPSLAPEELQSELRRRVGARVPEVRELKVSPLMKATLTGTNFEISPSEPLVQAVSREGTTEWNWDVRAKNSGTSPLTLTLFALVTVNGESTLHTIVSLSETINVTVTWPDRAKSFIGKNWQWLWTVIVVPTALLLWKRLKGRKNTRAGFAV